MGVSLVGAIANFFIPFAQIYQRIFSLNGSLDKPWLLLPFFLFPPLSIVPSVMMYLNMVEEGKGGKPYDYYMYIPIVLNIIIAIMNQYINSQVWSILSPFIPFVGGMLAFYLRYKNLCNDKGGVPLTKVLTDSVITQIVSTVTFMIMSYIPVVGIVFSLADMIPLLPQILTGLIYMAAYIVMNMINAYDLTDYCGTPASIGRWTGSGVLLVIYLVLKIVGDYLPI